MIVARALQAIGCAALIGAAVLAAEAKPEQETAAARSERRVCEAMAVSWPLLPPAERQRLGPPRPCRAPPREVWEIGTLTVAVQAALGALLLIGLGTGLADLRRIRERGERGHD